MEYITRAESGLVAPTSISPISLSLGIFDHWTAGPTDQTVREIQQFHMGPERGWTDIAYSWLVDTRGNIYEGRGWGRAGAHTKGFNSTSHAVCAICGSDGEVTDLLLDGMAQVMHEHDRRYGTGFHLPHRDAAGASTACPGDKIAGWVRGGFHTPDGGFTMGQMEQIAKWEHDTRRLILSGQVRAEEMHREAMLAEWRTRKVIRGDVAAQEASKTGVGSFHVPEDDPDADVIVQAEDADFIAIEGKRQLAELDMVPHTD